MDCLEFQHWFSYVVVAIASIHASWGFFHQYIVFFPSHWLLSHITIIKTKGQQRENNESYFSTVIEKKLFTAGIETATFCSEVLSYMSRSLTLGNGSLMHLPKVSIQVSLRGLRRLTWTETFAIDHIFWVSSFLGPFYLVDQSAGRLNGFYGSFVIQSLKFLS